MDTTIIKALWRVGRAALITATTQALVLQPDFSKPENAAKILGVAFISGFLFALGKGIREEWGDEDPSKGVINKLPI